MRRTGEGNTGTRKPEIKQRRTEEAAETLVSLFQSTSEGVCEVSHRRRVPCTYGR